MTISGQLRILIGVTKPYFDIFEGNLKSFSDFNNLNLQIHILQQDGEIFGTRKQRTEELLPQNLVSHATDFSYPPRSTDFFYFVTLFCGKHYRESFSDQHLIVSGILTKTYHLF